MPLDDTVFIVDDDPAACHSLAAVVESFGARSATFGSAEEFLAAHDGSPRGCLVTDVRMPGMSGLDLLTTLSERRVGLPVIVMTAYADVPLAVRAMQDGALTLLEKPCDENDLCQAIAAALERGTTGREAQQRRRATRDRLATLTLEERRILELVVDGTSNKAIAHTLKLGLRTVESRRHSIMTKMRTDSLVELVRMMVEAGNE